LVGVGWIFRAGTFLIGDRVRSRSCELVGVTTGLGPIR
jgi:hypothetical protein